MNILLCGAHGFIGQALEPALRAAGHIVIRAGRRMHRVTDIALDYRNSTQASVWLPHLQNIDVVINAVGIIAEQDNQRFDTLHTHAPKALFDACLQSNVLRIIQISALGAAPDSTTAYLRSKALADSHLATLPISSIILKPSLVFGAQGKSSRLFTGLASLPVCPVPGHGDQWIQPVHIDDLVETVIRLVTHPSPPRQLEVVGPRPVRFVEMLRIYRRGMGLSPALILPLPWWSLQLCIPILGRRLGGMLNADTLRMLRQGNVAECTALTTLLNRTPQPIETFISPARIPGWIQPMLRITLATLWLGSAFASVSPTGSHIGLKLAAQSAIPASLTTTALIGGAALDLIMGTLTLWRPGAKLWYTQIATVLFYTVFITIQLPAQWLHPFGPVLKNLPVLALLITLLSLPANTNQHGAPGK